MCSVCVCVCGVAESGSMVDLAILIQLVLGIAINCEQKDSKFVARW